MWIDNFEIQEMLLLVVGFIFFFLMLYFSVQSFLEKAYRAGRIFACITIILPLPYFILPFTEFQYQHVVVLVLLGITLLKVFIFLIPLKRFKRNKIDAPKNKTDERDIMFSRRLLKKGTPKHDDYYKRRPENIKPDEAFRKCPGLLNEGSAQFDPVMFASSEASFFTVDQLASGIDGNPIGRPQNFNVSDLSNYIKKWTKKLGALEVGITKLKDYHIYSHAGRGENYGKQVELNHKFAIAFTVEMNFEFTTAGPQAPIVMESGQQYLNAGAIAVQLAAFIRNLGHEARAHIDANYQVVCPLVAKDAGLGELGRMGLLMTPDHGPRVRIGVVTTNIPLLTDLQKEDHSMIEFCEICKKCAETCPSQAISSKGQEEIDGIKRWQINQEKCFQFWCLAGTDCGRCLAVCPFSHPDNFMHRMIRFGIKNNYLFRKIALPMDDFIYGRRPKVKEIPTWMRVRKKV